MLKSLWHRLFALAPPGSKGVRHARLGPRLRPRLEQLEDRLTPSDLTASISGTTLTLTKTSGINDTITIANSGSFQEFRVISTGGTIYTTPTRVTSIVLRLNSGDDTVILDGASTNGV